MPRRIGLTLDQWPDADRAAWERTTAPNDVFDTAAIAARWREKTRAQARYAYARWLTYLRDREPNALESPPAERLTPDRLEQYTLRLRQRLCEMSIAAELQHLSLALRALAPDIDWSWLRQRQYAVQKRARPREKRHKIVDPRRLVVLGNELMATAETQERRLERARRFRDGLLIALLATRPLRRRSLAGIEVGRQLQRVGTHYVIELAEDDTKTGNAVEFAVPDTLTPCIDAYLTRYRPMFPDAATTAALWLSTKGGRLGAEAIYDLVCRRTEQAFGISIHPHLFRDIAVTAIAREAPAALAVAGDLLTHSKLETTQKHYSRANTGDAGRRHAETIERLRSPR